MKKAAQIREGEYGCVQYRESDTTGENLSMTEATSHGSICTRGFVVGVRRSRKLLKGAGAITSDAESKEQDIE